MQYYNQGIFYIQTENEEKAINSFIKAKKNYKSPFIDSFIKAHTLNTLYESNYEANKDITFLISTLKDLKYSSELSDNFLKSILHKITQNNSNQSILEYISDFKNMPDSEKKNISIEYLYEYLARVESSNENAKPAISHSIEILKINDRSKIAKQIIEYFTFKKIALSTFEISDLEFLNESAIKHPFIKSNRKYNITLAHLYANISFKNFRDKNKIIGEEFKTKLEELIDNNDLLEEINKNLVSQLYLRAGNYYYYKDLYKASYLIFKKGISYLPNDSELIKRAKWAKEEF